MQVPELEYGQVLIKVLFSGVCRSQLMEVKGMRGPDKWLPHMLGHEGSGIVESIGPGVTKVKEGDPVILGWLKTAGIDSQSPTFMFGKEKVNAGKVTTFANYVVASENRVTYKPHSLPFDLAVLYGCALPTGAGMVLNCKKIQPGSLVAVLGLGGVGLSSLIALRAKTGINVAAIDISSEKLELAKALGANFILNASLENFDEDLKKIAPEGFDVCIESGGSISTIELGFEILNPKNGELIFASHPESGKKICLNPHELISGKKISGSWGGGIKSNEDLLRVHELLANSNKALSRLVTKKYSLEKINEAIKDLEDGKVFRPIICMEHEN